MIGSIIHSNYIFNSKYICKYINLNTSKDIDEIGRQPLLKIYRLIKIFIYLVINLIISRPDIVYFSITSKGIGFYKDAFLAIFVKVFRFKVVYHFHNKGVRDRQNYLLDNFLYKIVFHNSKVILLSKLLYTDFQKYLTLDQVFYCPNGIPNSISNTSFCVKKNDKILVNILFLSNMIESKGVFILLEACAILHKRNISFQCTFIGGFGNIILDDFTRKVKSLDLYNKVFYLGMKLGIEKEYAYQNADIFAFPTYYHNECFPLVLLEAMQFGLPIITTDEGAIPNIVVDGQTGFIIPQKNIQMLADKLELLIINKDLRLSLGLAGKKKYENEYTISHFEKTFTNIFNQII